MLCFHHKKSGAKLVAVVSSLGIAISSVALSNAAYAADPVRKETEFGARGQVLRESLPYRSGDPVLWREYSYDGLDRQVGLKHPDNNSVTTNYLPGDVFSAIEVTDENGNKRVTHFDEFGNEIYRDRFDGETRMRTSYRYDVLKRLVEITDPNGSKWFYAYDGHGNRTAAEDPDLGCMQMVYDDANRLASQYYANGSRVSYAYDVLNRVTTKTADKDALQFSSCEAINKAPVAVNDYGLFTTSTEPLVIADTTLLGNDRDPDGDRLSVFSVSSSANGSVELSANRKTITFTPEISFAGVTTFDYTVWDGEYKSSATVEITVAVPQVTPGSQNFYSSNTFTVPFYKTLTAVASGGGGGSGNTARYVGNGDNGYYAPGAHGNGGGSSSFFGLHGGGGGGGQGGRGSQVWECGDCRAASGGAGGASGGSQNVAGGGAGGGAGQSGPMHNNLERGGHGGAGGRAQKTWTLAQSGSPVIGQSLNVIVGGGGGGYQSGGGGAVSISWTVPTEPMAGPDHVVMEAGETATITVLDNDSDPNGNPLTITNIDGGAVSSGATVSVAGGSVTLNADKTLSYVASASSSGSKTFTYTISDGSETSTGTVTIEIAERQVLHVNSPITDQQSAEDTAWSFVVPADTFVDPEGDPLSYVATLADGTALPSWLGFDGTTRTFSGIPPQNYNGTVAIKVTVSDASSSVEDTFNLVIIPVNDAPIVAQAIPNQLATEETPWNFTVAAGAFSDTDGDALTYNATLADGTALPAWLSFDANTRAFTGTPPAASSGTLSLKVTAADGAAAVDDLFDLTIEPAYEGPVVANPIADQTLAEDTYWSFTVPANTFTDVNGDTLTFEAKLADGAALPSWVRFSSPARLSGRPPEDFHGTISLKVIASDASDSAEDDFDLIITPVNDEPKLGNPIPNQSATIGVAWSYTFPANTFADPEGNAFTYVAEIATTGGSSGGGRGGGDGSGSSGGVTALPSWLSFDAGTRTFSGTPPAGTSSPMTIVLTASESGSGSAVFSGSKYTPKNIDRFDLVISSQ